MFDLEINNSLIEGSRRQQKRQRQMNDPALVFLPDEAAMRE